MPVKSRETIAQFVQHGKHLQMEAGDVLLHEGGESSRLFLIVSGLVEVVKESADGKEFVLAYLGHEEFFGEAGLLSATGSSTALVRVKERCSLVFMHYEKLCAMPQLLPGITLLVATQLSARLAQTSTRAAELVFLEVKDRTLNALRTLAKNFGSATSDGASITISRKELARMIGAGREATGRAIGELETEGHLVTSQRAILVKRKTLLCPLTAIRDAVRNGTY